MLESIQAFARLSAAVAVPPGKVPLDLSLAATGGHCMARELIGEVLAGRIPEPCLAALRESTRRPGPGVGLHVVAVLLGFMVFIPVLVLSRWIEGIEASEDAPAGALARWYMFLLLGAVVLLVLRTASAWILRRRAVARDLIERRLRVEEGKLTQKWTSVGSVDDGWVRIGRRTLEVGSWVLFTKLGSGVRYRMYLSAHAGLLVAIESVDRPDSPSGYRDGPERHLAKQRGDVE